MRWNTLLCKFLCLCKIGSVSGPCKTLCAAYHRVQTTLVYLVSFPIAKNIVRLSSYLLQRGLSAFVLLKAANRSMFDAFMVKGAIFLHTKTSDSANLNYNSCFCWLLHEGVISSAALWLVHLLIINECHCFLSSRVRQVPALWLIRSPLDPLDYWLQTVKICLFIHKQSMEAEQNQS